QPHELAEVAADRGAKPGLAGGSPAPRMLGFERVLLVFVGRPGPLRQPVLPGVDPGCGADEVVVVDPVLYEPRSPVLDRNLHTGVRHQRLAGVAPPRAAAPPRTVSMLVPRSARMTAA